MSFDAYLEAAWRDHGDHAEAVAQRLAEAPVLIETSAQFAPFAKLVTHVYGEHLGRWDAGERLLTALREAPAWDADPGAEAAIAGAIAVLRFAAGDGAALQALAPGERMLALAAAAAVLTGRQALDRALSAFAAALQLAAPGLPPGSPVPRALAVGGNNLAAALEGKAGRDAAETHGMILAAEAGCRYWKLAGTWLEEERAEYRLARSLLQAGDPDCAARAAARCVELCESNRAGPFERFFGHAALALSQRASGNRAAFERTRSLARQLHELVPPDEKTWCAGDLAELEG